VRGTGSGSVPVSVGTVSGDAKEKGLERNSRFADTRIGHQDPSCCRLAGEGGVSELTPSLSRLTRWKRRGRLGALLAFVYLWAFAALGLTHTHRTLGVACFSREGGAVCAAASGMPLLTTVASVAEDPSCSLCDTAHATTAALVSPTLAVASLAAAGIVLASPIPLAPSRSLTSAQPRAPPQL
jgi:hypothetical protein